MVTEDEFDPESATKESCLSLGNEAAAWRDLFPQISRAAAQQGWDAATAREVWQAGVRYMTSETQCPSCGATLGPDADAARAEDDAIEREYPWLDGPV